MSALRETGPVFIVGMNGSGTTMLLDHLNNHSRLFGFAQETRILPYFIRKSRKYGDLTKDENYTRLWSDMAKAYAFWQVNNRRAIPVPAGLTAHTRRNPGTVFDEILSYFATQSGKQRWCEKTPMHALHIRAISEQLPEAKFIHMIRDGRDCAASFHRRWRYQPQRTIYIWKNTVKACQSQGSKLPGRYLEVRYEALTQNPESELGRICSFLGIDFEDAILSSSRNKVRNETPPRDSIQVNSGNYLRYFSSSQIRQLEEIAGSTLEALGYQPRIVAGDVDPGRVFLTLWSSFDYTRQVRGELQRRRRSGGRRTWGVVMRRITNAIQQKITNKF